MITTTFDFGTVSLGTLEDGDSSYDAVGEVTFGEHAMLQLSEAASGRLDRLSDLEPRFVTFVGADGLALTDGDYKAISMVPGLWSVDFDNSPINVEQASLFCREGMIGLNFGAAGISDDVMPLIGAVASLQHLVLSRSAVTDDGLRHLRDHPTLDALHVWETQVTADSSKTIATLPRLTELHFEGATDAVLKAAARNATSWLHLRKASVSEEGIAALASCQELTALALLSSELTPDACAGLGALTALEHLWLSYSTVDDSKLATAVSALANLKLLALRDATAGDETARAAGPLPALSSLILWGTAVTDEGVRALAGSRSLVELNLNHTKATDAGIADLAAIPTLEQLDHDGTAVTAAGRALLTQLPVPFELEV